MTEISIRTKSKDNRESVSWIISTSLARGKSIIKAAMKKTRSLLAEYEKRNNISSEKFFKKYHAGLAGDGGDVIDWAGEHQIYLDLKRNLEVLEDITFAH